MPKILIDHDHSLEIAHNALRVRRSLKNGDALDIRENGLYAEQKSGTGSGGFPDGYRSNNGIETGKISPINPDSKTKRVMSPSFTHRIFTCTQTDGSDISTRGGMDLILPGDMYRVLDTENDVYKYYIILKTTGTAVSTSAHIADVPTSHPCN